jgi:sugar phosphate isomerase/epimerase
VDVAADLGARSVTLHETQSRGRSGPPASLDVFVEAFARACDYAAGAELLVHLEYFPFSRVDDFTTASEIARRAARANGGVMVDTWHHCRGRDAGRDDFGEKTTSVLALQISDIRSVPLADVAHEARHLRLPPGEGVGDIARLIRALRAGGCTAPVGVEVYSDTLSALGPFDAARWAYESAVRVVSAASTLDRADGIAAPVAPGFEC